MRWGALLLALLLMVTPAEAAILFFSGAETGDLTEWGSHSGGFSASNAQLRTGGYGIFVTTLNQNLNSPAGLGQTTLFARLWVNFQQLDGDSYIALFFNAAGTKYICAGVNHSTGQLYFCHNSITPIASSTLTVTTGVFYRIDVKVVVSNTVGGVEIKVNGATYLTSLGTDTSDVGTIDFMQLFTVNDGATKKLNYDDVMLCSTAYCPPGGTIARQGAAGTPTYNAWTKNGCSGGTIDNCWSDTPFNTGSNASSSTASDAQTMLVSTFSSTQAGHGTETIAANSTINACKVIMVAKSGTAAAPFSIRRRLSGVDTDTARTLTTSDADYEDGPWITTPAILRGSTMEIGAVHGTGVALDTVEDVWMQCDYNSNVTVKHRIYQQ